MPYQAFTVSDGEVVVAVGTDRQWLVFCDAIEWPDLVADPRWLAVRGRIVGRAELVPEITRSMAARSMRNWIALFEPLGIPCSPINDYR